MDMTAMVIWTENLAIVAHLYRLLAIFSRISIRLGAETVVIRIVGQRRELSKEIALHADSSQNRPFSKEHSSK